MDVDFKSLSNFDDSIKRCKCAIKECTQEVYYDYQLPKELNCFQYCSPSCRDKILGGIRERLDEEIIKMEKNLRYLDTPLSEFVTDSKSQNTSKKNDWSSSSLAASSKGSGPKKPAEAGSSKPSGMINKFCH